MFSENRKTLTPPVDLPGLEMLTPPMIPPAEVSSHPGAAEDAELNRWSEERISIYASLDAAMTRHIIEAISALSELKQSAEKEAFRTSQKIIVERDQVKREVEALRLEQLQLTDQLKENRRLVQEETSRQLALEHSSSAWMEQARAERDTIQLEIKRLKVQLEEVRHDLQIFYRNRADAVEASGGYAAWIEKQAEMDNGKYQEPLIPPAPASTGPVSIKRLKPIDELPVFSLLDDDPAIEADLQEFDDNPTPRIEGGSPVIYPEQAASPITHNPLAFDLQEVEQNLTQDHAAVVKLIEESGPPLEGASPAPARLDEQPAEKTRDRNRRVGTEQRVNHLLKKRRPLNMAGEAPADSSGPSLPPPENVISRPKTGKRRAVLADNPKNDKETFQELGVQLGLDAMTPPPFSALRFAPGYTPPPQPSQLAEVVAELKANAGAIAVESPATPLVRPIKTSPKITVAPVDLIEPEEGARTLEELLEDGEHELATLNENPTPPDDPTPFIGNLSDNAVRFQADPITQPGQAQPDKVVMAVFGDNDHTAPRRDRVDSEPALVIATPAPAEKFEAPSLPTEPEPLAVSPAITGQDGARRRSPFMPLPAPPADRPVTEMGETAVTKVIVSNLQGRFSPLVMEKVVRSLAEVSHVIVTDFSKGVLGMDVRHKPDFDLAEKLLSLPELRLKLISHVDDALELSQENQS